MDLAFLEIMGVTKNSAFRAPDFKLLTRKEFLGASSRLVPTFVLEQEGHPVYDIYKWYERGKNKCGDIDQVDRMIKVIKNFEAFRSSEVPGDSAFERKIGSVLDEISVDGEQFLF